MCFALKSFSRGVGTWKKFFRMEFQHLLMLLKNSCNKKAFLFGIGFTLKHNTALWFICPYPSLMCMEAHYQAVQQHIFCKFTAAWLFLLKLFFPPSFASRMAAAVVPPQSTLRDVSSHRSVFFVYNISPGQSLMKRNGLIRFLYTSLYGGASLFVPVSGLSMSRLLMFELSYCYECAAWLHSF